MVVELQGSLVQRSRNRLYPRVGDAAGSFRDRGYDLSVDRWRDGNTDIDC